MHILRNYGQILETLLGRPALKDGEMVDNIKMNRN